MTPAQIEEHPVRDTLRQIREARNWNEVLEADANTLAPWLLERIFQFGDLAIQRLDGTPIFLVSLSGLNSINNALQSALSSLNAFKQTRSEGPLVEANQAVDAALQSMWAIPTTVVGDAQTAMAEAARAYFEQCEKAMGVVRQKADELDERLDGLSASITEADRTTGVVSEALAQQRVDAGAINAEVKRDFAVTDREYRDKFGALIEEHKTAHAQSVADQKAVADTALQELEAKRQEAARIVQIVGNIGVTGNYQRIADRETSQANTWRWISLAVLVAAGTFGAYTLLEFAKDEVRWLTAIVRMLFAFVIASIALYTSRESARHRTNADLSRRRELELASLGPFIESLPDEAKGEIRKKLTDLYFGGDVAPHVVEPAIPISSMSKIVDKVVDALLDLAKAKLNRVS